MQLSSFARWINFSRLEYVKVLFINFTCPFFVPKVDKKRNVENAICFQIKGQFWMKSSVLHPLKHCGTQALTPTNNQTESQNYRYIFKRGASLELYQ